MDPKQNSHIQPAAEHTPLDEAAARVLTDAGGAVHHAESEAEQLSSHAGAALGEAAPTVEERHLHPAAPSPQVQKQTLLDVLVDLLTLKWFKKNMRNKYGEDINKIRETRQAERVQHLQKPTPQYTSVPGHQTQTSPPTPPQTQSMPQAPQAVPSPDSGATVPQNATQSSPPLPPEEERQTPAQDTQNIRG